MTIKVKVIMVIPSGATGFCSVLICLSLFHPLYNSVQMKFKVVLF